MELHVIRYSELNKKTDAIINQAKKALFETGIIGISEIPEFITKSKHYITAVRQFSSLDESIKSQYTPHRDSGETVGYELGAEWFKDAHDQWQIDDHKASFYADVPNMPHNKWPTEVNLKIPFLALGELILQVGKELLDFIGLNKAMGIDLQALSGFGRMLHYQKSDATHHVNTNWCGSHFDHGVFTGLLPAYYFQENQEVEEPSEAGLFIRPTNSNRFEKVSVQDKSILLFQVGEFAQLASNDLIHATEHQVRKTKSNIERFTFALFFSPAPNTKIASHSKLIQDPRSQEIKTKDGSIIYDDWAKVSFARYRAL